MLAFSVKQPHAGLILLGHKPIEVRTRGPGLLLGHDVVLCSSQEPNETALIDFAAELAPIVKAHPEAFAFGVTLAVVRIPEWRRVQDEAADLRAAWVRKFEPKAALWQIADVRPIRPFNLADSGIRANVAPYEVPARLIQYV